MCFIMCVSLYCIWKAFVVKCMKLQCLEIWINACKVIWDRMCLRMESISIILCFSCLITLSQIYQHKYLKNILTLTVYICWNKLLMQFCFIDLKLKLEIVNFCIIYFLSTVLRLAKPFRNVHQMTWLLRSCLNCMNFEHN